MAPHIRYVCLSDLHLGADTSLLTEVHPLCEAPDPTVASDVMESLVACLRALVVANDGRRPTLVLLGDVLEFALARDEVASMVFERFVERVMAPGAELFDAIWYVPGNHDHHLWETARERQYAEYIRPQEPGKPLLAPWHSTRMLLGSERTPVVSPLLTALTHRARRRDRDELAVRVAYPNLAVREKERCVVFHHGHFIESTYAMLTKIDEVLFPEKPVPASVWDLEADNFAWIDFLWSGLGRCGQAGESVEYVYDAFQDPRKEEELLDRLAASLGDACEKLPWLKYVPDALREVVIREALEQLAHAVVGNLGARDSIDAELPLSERQKAGLAEYVDRYVLDQIGHEMSEDMPAEVAFVFGHTHAPFESATLRFPAFPRPVHVYNTGGWNHEKADREKQLGASLVLLDDDLNIASLRMYNELKELSGYRVHAAEAREEPGKSEFVRFLDDVLERDPEPWARFVEAVDKTLDERAWRFGDRRREA